MKGMKFDKWKFLISHMNDEIQARHLISDALEWINEIPSVPILT